MVSVEMYIRESYQKCTKLNQQYLVKGIILHHSIHLFSHFPVVVGCETRSRLTGNLVAPRTRRRTRHCDLIPNLLWYHTTTWRAFQIKCGLAGGCGMRNGLIKWIELLKWLRYKIINSLHQRGIDFNWEYVISRRMERWLEFLCLFC